MTDNAEIAFTFVDSDRDIVLTFSEAALAPAVQTLLRLGASHGRLSCIAIKEEERRFSHGDEDAVAANRGGAKGLARAPRFLPSLAKFGWPPL